MDTSIPQDFYVYFLENSLTHQVFYIGKGRNKRVSNHEWYARKHESCTHRTCHVIRKIWREGGHVIKYKVCDGVCEQSAFRVEKFLIAYGRISGWPLTNHADGGEPGPTGSKRTPAQIEAQRQRSKEMMSRPGRKELQSQIMKGRKNTPEQLEKHRQSMQFRYANDSELHERKSQGMKAFWDSSPDLREQYRSRMQNPSIRAKAGEANIGNTYNAKFYPGFVSPSNIVHANIHNLKAFCIEHNLSPSKMCLVNNEKRHSHQGWTKYRPEIIQPSLFFKSDA